MRIEKDREVVGLVAQQCEPAGMADDDIKQVAMNDQVAAAVGGPVDEVFDDLDAPEMRAVEFTQELVVIAGDIDNARALAGLAQELLHDVIVRLRPVPARLEVPAVDNI